MSVIKNIYEFVTYKGITITEFSKNVEVSNGYFAKQRISEGAVSSNIIEKIVIKYPEINLEWLLIGQGSMLKSPIKEASGYVIEEPAVAYGKEDTSSLELENKLLKDIIKGNEGIIKSKDDTINSKDDIILMLKKDNTRLEIENEHLRTKIEKWSPAEIKPTKEKNKTIKNQDNPLEKKTETNLELLNKPKLTQEPY